MSHFIAIETAGECCSVALKVGSNHIQQCIHTQPRAHAKYILSMLDELLNTHNISKHQLTAIAFSQGPGSFTGLRIGVGIVQGLAFALNIPVIPVSTLQAMAQGVYRNHNTPYVLVALDARMGEVYWGAYHLAYQDKIMLTLQADMVCKPNDVLVPEHYHFVGVGSGWQVYEQILTRHVDNRLNAIMPVQLQAYDVLSIGLDLYQKGLVLPAEQAQPRYLRDNVVRSKS